MAKNLACAIVVVCSLTAGSPALAQSRVWEGSVFPVFCGSCHLPTGTGHDESAYLAGLPVTYIIGQMADFKSGTRKGFGDMPAIGQALPDAVASIQP